MTTTSTEPEPLVVDWCSHEAAHFAVTRWHYSQVMPAGKLVKIGVWEHGHFIGAVVFGRGASPNLGRRYSLHQGECCELVRVALTDHEAPVTKIVAEAIRLLRAQSPGVRLIISFADPGQGHRGTIYQAGNWLYLGQSADVVEYRIGGRWRHTRGAYHHPQKEAASTRTAPGKYRYAMPLDRAIRRQLKPLVEPYPDG